MKKLYRGQKKLFKKFSDTSLTVISIIIQNGNMNTNNSKNLNTQTDHEFWNYLGCTVLECRWYGRAHRNSNLIGIAFFPISFKIRRNIVGSHSCETNT